MCVLNWPIFDFISLGRPKLAVFGRPAMSAIFGLFLPPSALGALFGRFLVASAQGALNWSVFGYLSPDALFGRFLAASALGALNWPVFGRLTSGCPKLTGFWSPQL